MPRGFAVDAGARPETLAKFHHMTGSEARSLELQGQIEKIAPKLWRRTLEACATARATETGDGLLSRQIGKWLRDAMQSEMNRSNAGI